MAKLLAHVPVICAMVMRDPTEKIPVKLAAHEIPLLVKTHDGRVDVIGPDFNQDGDPITVTVNESSEITRLMERHGEKMFTAVYGPAMPGCLERVIDSVLEMADSDDEVLTEQEEHAMNERAKARQRRLSSMAARRKGVKRPRRGQELELDDEDEDEAVNPGQTLDQALGQALTGTGTQEDDGGFEAEDQAEEDFLESEGEESDVDGPDEQEGEEEAQETAEQEAARKRSEAAKKAAAKRAANKAAAKAQAEG